MAYRTSQERVWPYLVILGLLFFFVLSVPRHWERTGRDRNLDQVLAARPPATARATVAATVVVEPPAESVQVPVEQPAPEVVVVEPSDPIEDVFELPSHIVEAQGDWADPPADPPLPPAEDDPYAMAAPLDGWPRPHALLSLLERLADEPMYTSWAEETSELVRSLTTERRPSAARTLEILDAIEETIASIQELIEKTEYHDLQSQLRRTRYGMSRRLDLWRLAHEATRNTYDRLASRAPLDELSLPPKIIAPPVGDAVREVRAFTEQYENGPTWDRYLRLADLDQLATDADADSETHKSKRRQVAHHVLRRLAHVNNGKRYIPVTTNPAIGQLREALRHWASETVDARELLEHIEQYEMFGLPSDARHIALYYQRLAWAPEERDQQLGTRLARHYRNANVRMAVSEVLLNRLLPEPSTITEPIDDIIAGTPSIGTSDTRTKLRLRLVRDARRLHLTLEAHGVVHSESESDAGFATLFSRGTSQFAARKNIVVDLEQIHLMPAIARADSSNELVDIMTRLDAVPLFGSLAGNIVRAQRDRRYDEVVSEVEYKVAHKARRRLDEEVVKRTAAAEKRLQDKVVSPLKQFGLDPTTISLATTDKRVIFRHRLAGYEQLGAHTPRPRAPYYEPQIDGLKIRLVRQGSFEIVSRKYGKKPQFLLRSIVARMLAETKEFDVMPAKVADDQRIADLAVTQLDLTDGWIALALGPKRSGHFTASREPVTKKE